VVKVTPTVYATVIAMATHRVATVDRVKDRETQENPSGRGSSQARARGL